MRRSLGSAFGARGLLAFSTISLLSLFTSAQQPTISYKIEDSPHIAQLKTSEPKSSEAKPQALKEPIEFVSPPGNTSTSIESSKSKKSAESDAVNDSSPRFQKPLQGYDAQGRVANSGPPPNSNPLHDNSKNSLHNKFWEQIGCVVVILVFSCVFLTCYGIFTERRSRIDQKKREAEERENRAIKTDEGFGEYMSNKNDMKLEHLQ